MAVNSVNRTKINYKGNGILHPMMKKKNVELLLKKKQVMRYQSCLRFIG